MACWPALSSWNSRAVRCWKNANCMHRCADHRYRISIRRRAADVVRCDLGRAVADNTLTFADLVPWAGRRDELVVDKPLRERLAAKSVANAVHRPVRVRQNGDLRSGKRIVGDFRKAPNRNNDRNCVHAHRSESKIVLHCCAATFRFRDGCNAHPRGLLVRVATQRVRAPTLLVRFRRHQLHDSTFLLPANFPSEVAYWLRRSLRGCDCDFDLLAQRVAIPSFQPSRWKTGVPPFDGWAGPAANPRQRKQPHFGLVPEPKRSRSNSQRTVHSRPSWLAARLGSLRIPAPSQTQTPCRRSSVRQRTAIRFRHSKPS